MLIDDVYGPAGFVRRWALDSAGQAYCEGDGLDPNDAGAVTALKRTAATRAMIGLVEAYEGAQRVPAPADGEPPDAYDAAQAVISGASAPTSAHALWRAGEPPVSDPPSDGWTAWDAARTAGKAEFDRLAALPLASDPRPVPQVVTLFQGRQVLRNTPGPAPYASLFDAVDAYVNANAANHALDDAWHYSKGFDRDGALIASLAPAFGLTGAQIDALFRAAATIKG